MTIYELGSSLEKLLSTLKKNRENVPLETLRTVYKEPYEALLRQINETASEFVREIVITDIPVNPDASIDAQSDLINQTIDESGLVRQISLCLLHTYNVHKLHIIALELRRQIVVALEPYIAMKNCLVADPENLDADPIIYNTITRKVYENNAWIERDLDLSGKLLIYIKQPKDISQPIMEENTNEQIPENISEYAHQPATADG